jgi:hypothetical protein
MHTFEKTLFNAMLPMFERALADAAHSAREVSASASVPAAAPADQSQSARSPAPQLPRAA